MEERDKRKLQVHRETLVDCIADVQPVLDGLISRCVISPLSDDYQSVLAGGTAREQTRLLLDILPTLGADAFDAFVESLATYRPHLSRLLKEDAVEDEAAMPTNDIPAKSTSTSASQSRPRSGWRKRLLSALPRLRPKRHDVPDMTECTSDFATPSTATVDPSRGKDNCDLNKGPFAPARPSVELVRRIQKKQHKSYIQLSQRRAAVVDFRFGPSKVGLENVCATISALNFDDVQAEIQEKRRTKSIGGEPISKMATEMASTTFASRCRNEMELIDLGQLFRAANGESVESCLLVGPAGAGKSVLLERIMACWAGGGVEELAGFELVVYVSGRDAKVLGNETTVGMLGYALQRQCELSDSERAEVEKYIRMNSERVLVLLDAADEGGSVWSESEAVERLVQRRSVEDCTFVVTSRPCTQAYELVLYCQQRFYLIGLNDRRLDELLVRRLGEEDGVRVAESLKEPGRERLRELMKETPLVANIVAKLASGPGRAKSLPRTTTEIYTAMALDMIRHERVKRDKTFGQGKVMLTFDDLPEEVQRMVQELGKLALDCLRQRQFVMDMKTVESVCGKEAIDLGFLNKYEVEMGGCGAGTSHEAEFWHLTWLEFFAAYSVCSQSPSPGAVVKSCVDVVGVGEETEPFWRFVCGLVEPERLEDVLSSLQTAFFHEHRSAIQKRQWLWLSHRCVAEAAQQRTVSSSVAVRRLGVEKATAAVVPSMIDLSNSRPSVADAQVLSISLQHSPHVKTLTMDECGLNASHFTALAGGLSHVKELRCNWNFGVHGDGLIALVHSLRQCNTLMLRVLYIRCCLLNEDDCPAISNLLCGIPSLLGLYLGRNPLGTPGVLQLHDAVVTSGVATLELWDNGLDSGAGSIWGKLIEHKDNLFALDIAGNQLGNTGVRDLLEGVWRSCSLQLLNLDNTGVDDSVMGAVAQCLSRRCVQRENSSPVAPLTISLHGNSISRESLECVAMHTPSSRDDRVQCGSLTVQGGTVIEQDYAAVFKEHALQGGEGDLYLADQGIGETDAVQIASLLLQDCAVHALSLGSNLIGNSGASALGEALRVNTVLRGLSLQSNQVGSGGFVSLVTSLAASNTTLAVLNLGSNAIFSSGNATNRRAAREALERLLGRSSGLRFLDLERTGLGDDRCKAIGAALASDKCCLSFLSMRENEISDVGVERLCSGLERNSTVQYIDLFVNQISNDGVERIARCVESRARRGCPLQRVWLGGNQVDAQMLTGCLVDGFYVSPSHPDYVTKVVREFADAMVSKPCRIVMSNLNLLIAYIPYF